MLEVTMYTTSTCPYCRNAKQLLSTKGIPYTEISVHARDRMLEMMDRSGRRTVPQIFIGERHVGGFDDLAKLDRQGGLIGALNADVTG